MNPIVIAYHLIWTVYGWWLPNDPRGSGSEVIHSDVLAELGALHQGRKRVQPAGPAVREFYEEAAGLLNHPRLRLGMAEISLVAAAFAEVIATQRYTCYACAILPDHVHLIIRKHKHLAEEMIDHLQYASRLRLSALGGAWELHPVWTRGSGWKVFLDHPDEIRRTIPYVEDNPRKAEMPSQEWAFVKTYDNWPLHEGHSLNSPYVRALRAAGRYP